MGEAKNIYFTCLKLNLFKKLFLNPQIKIIKMSSVKDVDQQKFVVGFADFLKKSGKMTVPEWADLIKLSRFNEQGPHNQLVLRACGVDGASFVHPCVSWRGFLYQDLRRPEAQWHRAQPLHARLPIRLQESSSGLGIDGFGGTGYERRPSVDVSRSS